MTDGRSASRTSSDDTTRTLGTPVTRSRPLTDSSSSGSSFWALPISHLIRSAVRDPMSRLWCFLKYCITASSSSLPPTRIDSSTTMPLSAITAISVVPPPMSTIMLPTGSETWSPIPMAAAIGSSISITWRAPAFWAASLTARRSTSVIPEGTQITIRPMDDIQPGLMRRMKPRISASATEKSAITPSLSGRMVSMSLCVRSCIRSASVPMATGLFERRSRATMDGSLSTIPLSRTWMRVLAVPRSMATSTENGLSTGEGRWDRTRTEHAPMPEGSLLPSWGRNRRRDERWLEN